MAGLLFHLNRGGRAADASLLNRGLKTMQHRGIDGASNWLYRTIALGQQNFLVCPEDMVCPLLRNTEEGAIALAFDGRLDNREALLGEIGPAETADCADAELVLIAYQRWGEACFSKLRGFLAMIIADFASEHLASVGRSFTAYSWALPGFPVADESPLIRALAEHAGLTLKIADADDCWPLSRHEARPLSPNTPLSNAFQRLKDRVYGMAADDGCMVLLNAAVGDSLYAGNGYYLADLFSDRQWRRFAGEFYRRLASPPVLRLHHDPLLRGLVKQVLGVRRTLPRSPEWLAEKVLKSGEDLHNWPPESIEHLRPNQYRTLLGLDLSGVSTPVDFFANRFGLEIRDPYLDWDLADFMLSIPSYRAERPGELKYFARNAMRGMMLESLRTQSRKGVLSEFFDYGLFKRSRPLLNRLLTAKEAEWPEYVDRRWLLTALAKEQPSETEAMVIWQCVAFEMWRIRFRK